MIVAKVQRLEQIGDKALTAALLQDLALLEQDYETLAKDLRDNADNQQLIKAMVENYRSRLQLLERILNEIEQKQSDEKADTQL
jgi:Ser/Thr protein kinase RdoA (MazF antagonist)